MDRALADLIRISRRVGGDPALVGVGGGNTSVKTDDGRHMYIKASGVDIRDLARDRGWRRVSVEAVGSILSDQWVAQLPDKRRQAAVAARLQVACEDELEGGGRPSTESPFHALLGRCVAHLHSPAVLAHVCAKNGGAEIERVLGGDQLPPLWVPYTDPGYALANRIAALIVRYERRHGCPPSVLFLQNHGLLVSADRVEPLLSELERLVRALTRRLSPTPAAKQMGPAKKAVRSAKLQLRRARFQATGERACVRHTWDAEIAGMLERGRVKPLVSSAVTPDEIVYAGGSPLWLQKAEASAFARAIERRLTREGLAPAAFLVKGMGLFALGSAATADTVLDMTRSSLLVKWQAGQVGGVHPLSRAQRQFIGEWEAESYRRKLAGGKADGELSGRIAVVTGAGSGLGRSIAIGLAKAGALVALADIDTEATAAARELIAERVPGATTIAVECNVTDEQQAAAAFTQVVDEWGGLDLLVNAAGIAPAYDLVDLPPDAWERTLAVNLTGYFIMGQAAARIMTEQGIGGSIVNISSKSGLEASKSNTPYNATKAGQIHMARGWALELGHCGIRVNSVAPGNVFEGSKIWGPEYIHACAEKYGLKPSEVIPYYISRTALGEEITGQDIADSVVFLCSDRARTITGQTLVPDGGQVFVR